MNGCTSDPTSGCDNSEIVAAIGSCCLETNANLTAISAKLTTINETQIECCAEVNTNLTEVIRLLTIIAG